MPFSAHIHWSSGSAGLHYESMGRVCKPHCLRPLYTALLPPPPPYHNIQHMNCIQCPVPYLAFITSHIHPPYVSLRKTSEDNGQQPTNNLAIVFLKTLILHIFVKMVRFPASASPSALPLTLGDHRTQRDYLLSSSWLCLCLILASIGWYSRHSSMFKGVLWKQEDVCGDLLIVHWH